jgi:hypothetical protein
MINLMQFLLLEGAQTACGTYVHTRKNRPTESFFVITFLILSRTVSSPPSMLAELMRPMLLSSAFYGPRRSELFLEGLSDIIQK